MNRLLNAENRIELRGIFEDILKSVNETSALFYIEDLEAKKKNPNNINQSFLKRLF